MITSYSGPGTTKNRSDSWLSAHVQEIGNVGAPSDFAVHVVRSFPKRDARRMQCKFTAAKSSENLLAMLRAVADDQLQPRRNHSLLAILADAIEEDPNWSKEDKELRWFLTQLRRLGGVQTARSR